ncbi:MAG: hypothetical protein ABSC22_14365, partial [Roseiarcus sp.]
QEHDERRRNQRKFDGGRPRSVATEWIEPDARAAIRANRAHCRPRAGIGERAQGGAWSAAGRLDAFAENSPEHCRLSRSHARNRRRSARDRPEIRAENTYSRYG